MSGRIVVDFAMCEGAVPRMLGLIERRGFDLCGIVMSEREGAGSLSLDVRARDSNRRLEVMAGQLRRLHEVRLVTLPNAQPELHP